ncbi:MAG: ABC-F family ATP-binding cassette domain-containing protein [Clostridiales bacterium]|nr:ABC-F family ATP-binding cassette domain-containing protein [Clostridiales bacterium]
MSVINIEHISKLYGDRMVLDDLSCSVDYGDKIGIIGINGTGKSTLLRLIAGDEETDSGDIVLSRGLTVGWLPQTPVFAEEESALSYVCGDAAEDYAFESEAKSMLDVLEIYDVSCEMGQLSGGQRKRVALCKVLLQKPDILILDEPTNHLDNRMTEWLEGYLTRYKEILLMVTHDRYFLDRVTNRLWEIDRGQVYQYETNYSGYLEQKMQREDMERAAEQKRQSILRVELQWVMRGARARSTKQKARLERYERLKNMESPQSAKQVEMEAVGARLGKKTIELQRIAKGYGGKTLVSDFSYIFQRYERIGFVGTNGCGKSTLMRILAGLEEPDSGTIDWGETIKIGYFAQECEVMDERQRVIDYIKDQAEYIRTSTGHITASRMLERFLFSPDMQYAPISKISGGERRRLYLLRVLMSSPNVLILDEPTNDLDIATLQALEDFLDSFLGIVIVVSHDRYFLDRIADRIASFEDGRIIIYEGGYSEYLEKRKRDGFSDQAITHVEGSATVHKKKESKRDSTQVGQDKNIKTGEKGSGRRSRPQKLRFTYAEQKEYETIDDDIALLEEELQGIDAEIEKCATDFVKLNEWTQKREETQERLDKKTERWVYLTDLAEQIENQKNGIGI